MQCEYVTLATINCPEAEIRRSNAVTRPVLQPIAKDADTTTQAELIEAMGDRETMKKSLLGRYSTYPRPAQASHHVLVVSLCV